ncbi:hypothetical protein RJ639_004902 [Escallonia herrerae]|uniref:2-isopropylmalate synthase n=1 Tax=Escallonia herrerae TaxID=1293975 RepID=A0AA88W1K8_9ASTE|nr:hypothetical protein RJ639_004902 [Escallonia herrerae]
MDSLTICINPTFSFNPANKAETTSFFFEPKPRPFICIHRARTSSVTLKAKSTFCHECVPRPLYIPNKISDASYVRVLDTTLRDGEQAPGATMSTQEKLAIARQLAKLGVDVIEAGFPVASKADFEAVRMIAKEVGNSVDEFGYSPVIGAVSRMVVKDIDLAWEAVKFARHPRMCIFIPTSEIHLKYKLNKTKEEVLKIVKEMVSYTRKLGVTDIQFVSEDSARSEKEFLYQVFGEAIRGGATTIVCTDTVGCVYPTEWGEFIADMKAKIPGAENVIISTHCHNDLGLANANTLAAVNAGARQVEVTINGIGERAGNASFEEFVMALKCRGKDLLGGLHTGINTKYLASTSTMDGMLKHKSTYEFISPEDIGLSRSNERGIVLGKLSGRHALKSRLIELGHDIDEKEFDDVFLRFKEVAEHKKVTNNGLE